MTALRQHPRLVTVSAVALGWTAAVRVAVARPPTAIALVLIAAALTTAAVIDRTHRP